ncbi:hypothetical protein M406DRAFT_333571 [Cryphonectria parasitica EP155]|uniref:Uncharacterized protein n=1 Tax=Cryphonectria parasitica (strain ATCC 38755 / EP155) TaxID=660469 RepID=A0A9P5CKZ9_CRYP1|nr:uncharacterized protein M406DRAFT_333571 [Cryphonectria parasitica EP155]KAF3761511.1 hypothetical protein M406DRAFT_333571 [Cryphonectria parasitica EP155]
MAALSYVLSSVALLGGAALAEGNYGFTVGDNSLNWTEVRSLPNATGSITFTAPNVSAPFQAPDAPSVPGWTMSIAVRTNGTSDALTATSISLDAPPSLQAANGSTLADPSWYACVYSLGPTSKGGFSNGSFTHATCGDVLSTTCVDEWVSNAASWQGSVYENTTLSRHANFNGSDVVNWATSDVTYNDAVGGVWPVLIRWQGNESTLVNGADSNATLQCVQAYDVQAGSKLPSMAARSSSSRVVTWAAGTALVVALYVL